jgi:ABC-type transporter Mla MlaB component
MITRFCIQTRPERGRVVLELAGDFDASAAMQLLYALRHHWTQQRRVTIDTSSLNRVEALGLNLFRYNLCSSMAQAGTVTFAGSKAELLRQALSARCERNPRSVSS